MPNYIIIIHYVQIDITPTGIMLCGTRKMSSSDTFYYAGVCINDISKTTF